MPDKSVIETIKDREMDRKSFLKTFGLVAVSLVGVRGLTNMLMAPIMKDKNKSQGPTGFGTGKFGV